MRAELETVDILFTLVQQVNRNRCAGPLCVWAARQADEYLVRDETRQDKDGGRGDESGPLIRWFSQSDPQMQVGEASPVQPRGLELQGDALIAACMMELCWSMRRAWVGTTAASDWLPSVTRPGCPCALIGRAKPPVRGSDFTCQVAPGSSGTWVKSRSPTESACLWYDAGHGIDLWPGAKRWSTTAIEVVLRIFEIAKSLTAGSSMTAELKRWFWFWFSFRVKMFESDLTLCSLTLQPARAKWNYQAVKLWWRRWPHHCQTIGGFWSHQLVLNLGCSPAP